MSKQQPEEFDNEFGEPPAQPNPDDGDVLEEGPSEEPPEGGEGGSGEGESGDEGEGKPESAKAQPVRDQAWWERRAKHFENEYKRERTKRQTYERGGQGAGLANLSQQSLASGNGADTATKADKKLDDMNLQEFAEYIRESATKEAHEKWTEGQLDDRVRRSEAWARKHFDGKGDDGMPSYDDLMSEIVYPYLERNPNAFKLLRQMENPAHAAYTLGLLMHPDMMLQARNKVAAKARTEVVDNIERATQKAQVIKGRNNRQISGKMSKADFERMSVEDFDKEIEKVKSGAAS